MSDKLLKSARERHVQNTERLTRRYRRIITGLGVAFAVAVALAAL